MTVLSANYTSIGLLGPRRQFPVNSERFGRESGLPLDQKVWGLRVKPDEPVAYYDHLHSIEHPHPLSIQTPLAFFRHLCQEIEYFLALPSVGLHSSISRLQVWEFPFWDDPFPLCPDILRIPEYRNFLRLIQRTLRFLTDFGKSWVLKYVDESVDPEVALLPSARSAESYTTCQQPHSPDQQQGGP